MSKVSPQALSFAKCLARVDHAEHLESVGRISEARAVFASAMDHAAGCFAKVRFAAFLLRTEEFTDAITLLESLQQEAASTGDGALMSVVANNLAAVYRERGQADLARRLQQVSLSCAARSARPTDLTASPMTVNDAERDDLEHLAADLSNLANDAILAEDFSTAERLLESSFSIETSLGNLPGQASDLGSLGVVAMLQGDLTTAVKRLREALALHAQLGDLRSVGNDLLNLSQAYGNLGAWDEAVATLELAVGHFGRCRAVMSESRARLLLTEARRRRRVASVTPEWN